MGVNFILLNQKSITTIAFILRWTGNREISKQVDFVLTPLLINKISPNAAVFIIERKYDKERKKEKLEELKQQGSFDSSKEYTLHLVKPTWGRIVNDFIAEYQLSDKLADIITSNGSGNEIPEFLSEYQFLEQKFLEFF